MRQRIRIRMPLRTAIGVYVDAAQHERPAFDQSMRVSADSDP
jgi:hypothetical protein